MNKWTEIQDPALEQDGFAETLITKINILDILNKYKIDYTTCFAGNFSHKCKCPFSFHSNGEERTASFFISEQENSFYCFGCNSGGSVIDFVKLYLGKPYYEAVRWLAKYADLTQADPSIMQKRYNPKDTVVFHVIKSGVLIRDKLVQLKGTNDYEKWCIWAEKRFDKLDEYLNTLDDYQWETVEHYYGKIKKFINKNT